MYLVRSLPALVLTLLPVSAAAQDRLLPALDCAKKTPEQWMEEFATGDSPIAEPLWCLYWSDARTPQVLDFLESWRAKLPDSRPIPASTPPPRNIGREIDEIQTQWNIARAPLQPQWTVQREGEVLHELDAMLKVVVATPGQPVPTGSFWYRVPSGLFPYPMGLSEEPDARLLERLASDDAFEMTRSAVTLIARRHELARAIQALVRAAAKDRVGAPKEDPIASANTNDQCWRLSCHHEREPWTVQVFELRYLPHYALEWATGVTDRVGAGIVARMILRSDEDAAAVALVTQPVPGGTALRLSDAGWKLLDDAWATRRGHLNPPHTDAAPAPTKPMRIDPASFSFDTQISQLSDPENKRDRSDRVLHAGEAIRLALVRGDSFESELRPLLAELQVPYTEQGADGPGDWYVNALNVIGSLRLSTPDVAEACIGVLLQKEHFSTHVDLCIPILERCTLSLRQKALAVQMDDQWLSEPYSAFFAQLGPVAVERAARLRTHAQAWSDMSVLADVLKISRPHTHDIEMLIAALERGFVTDRLQAIAILSDHSDFDSPELRRALVAAGDDIDDDVRAAAIRVRKQRAW